ncbi:MAG: 2-oxoacid:acceptor oxidoreductase family protein [Acidobacteria bacterium]|nr:2-oxoacid:acceptor oxidoreductase family protein [Acidobacteriota bacterium]MBU4306611.1 2-oxoacid:acceptor oxidoreductase family protein [Acidobacteriota bacterium]MBU4405575.1 2-oxoacid:acceptor oxidoreductase family protein [Acidobacteriota bacterium]MCG2811559.1 2-oxoacid:acceptor oxidoreductase family protein [Candidatus Aminicenantes bacterium]
MYQGIRISGFGGQGIISAGILLAQAGMIENKHVSWFPAYGAEMRGGTANCSVVVSSDEVASPIVARPDTVIVMNEPSLAKFEPMLKPGGLLIINSSLVNSKPQRSDIRVAYVACNKIAEEIGTTKIANMVALGAFMGLTGALGVEAISKALPKVFKRAKPELLELNVQALKKGAETKIS